MTIFQCHMQQITIEKPFQQTPTTASWRVSKRIQSMRHCQCYHLATAKLVTSFLEKHVSRYASGSPSWVHTLLTPAWGGRKGSLTWFFSVNLGAEVFGSHLNEQQFDPFHDLSIANFKAQLTHCLLVDDMPDRRVNSWSEPNARRRPLATTFTMGFVRRLSPSPPGKRSHRKPIKPHPKNPGADLAQQKRHAKSSTKAMPTQPAGVAWLLLLIRPGKHDECRRHTKIHQVALSWGRPTRHSHLQWPSPWVNGMTFTVTSLGQNLFVITCNNIDQSHGSPLGDPRPGPGMVSCQLNFYCRPRESNSPPKTVTASNNLADTSRNDNCHISSDI